MHKVYFVQKSAFLCNGSAKNFWRLAFHASSNISNLTCHKHGLLPRFQVKRPLPPGCPADVDHHTSRWRTFPAGQLTPLPNRRTAYSTLQRNPQSSASEAFERRCAGRTRRTRLITLRLVAGGAETGRFGSTAPPLKVARTRRAVWRAGRLRMPGFDERSQTFLSREGGRLRMVAVFSVECRMWKLKSVGDSCFVKNGSVFTQEKYCHFLGCLLLSTCLGVCLFSSEQT